MMSLSVSQYTKALYQVSENKSPKEIDFIINNFLKILQKNRQMKLVEKIIAEFSLLFNKKNKIIEAEIISRDKLTIETQKKIEEFLIKKYEIDKVITKNVISQKIKGGIIIKTQNERIDFSVANQLLKLKRALIK